MLKPGTIAALLSLLTLPCPTSAASLAENYIPGTPYYFSDFDPGQRPWEPGQPLNIEEVFQNYQYYEIVFNKDGKGITVHHFLRGIKNGSEKYLVLPDDTLRKE